ncbi:Bug family tripartite tricarboxylate transporter substrate binding protein [Falsiroseomonas tokyonensis]|uniref:Bug family tripartite tricarboxylate transporter substrate binding protein n=1 Tax=Falsiroseomonas tokyonensis TaxID=430521 RepID=A0ABV7BUJ2_9PROT|nr:tripartite tricarboxylate transporter substrate binding protein [Falsiroseomonas tokyonensis]MBU8538508.1 tripartite tricarboxylate transporter substrate binding protein [Falsiroseomonas tokyonensis]
MTTRRGALAGLATILAAPPFLAARKARAQPAWTPNRPLRLFVTYPPGGVTDIVGRLAAEALGPEIGQPVLVENRAGAGGNLGMQAALAAPADGTTLMLGTVALFGVNPVLYANSGVDGVRDFAPLGMLGEAANVLSAVPARLAARNVAELVAEGRRRPLTYGSVGNGSSSHLSAVLLLKTLGLEATHVPYRGSAPLVTAMLAGEVDFGFDTTATSTAHVQSGAFRALGVTTARRASSLPEVPTLQEAGLAGYALSVWFGLFAPAATPPERRARLEEAVARSQTPALAEKLRRAFVDPLTVPRAELPGWVAADAARWQQLARDARIELN